MCCFKLADQPSNPSKTLASRWPILRAHCMLLSGCSHQWELLPLWALENLVRRLRCEGADASRRHWWPLKIWVPTLTLEIIFMECAYPLDQVPQGSFLYLITSPSAAVDVFTQSHIPRHNPLSSQHWLLFHHLFFPHTHRSTSLLD